MHYRIPLLPISVAEKSSYIFCHSTITYGRKSINVIKDHMETKQHLSKILDLHDAHLLPGQSDPMNGKIGLSPVSSLSTQTVPTRLADDIRLKIHINDRVGNMEARLIVLIPERKPLFLYDW